MDEIKLTFSKIKIQKKNKNMNRIFYKEKIKFILILKLLQCVQKLNAELHHLWKKTDTQKYMCFIQNSKQGTQEEHKIMCVRSWNIYNWSYIVFNKI